MSESADPDCIFCRIVAGDVPATIFHRDDGGVAFHDTNPQAPVHLLVVPHLHVPSISELDNGAAAAWLGAIAACVARLEQPDGYRLVVNRGDIAGQTVPHLHAHLLAGRQLTWPPG